MNTFTRSCWRVLIKGKKRKKLELTKTTWSKGFGTEIWERKVSAKVGPASG